MGQSEFLSKLLTELGGAWMASIHDNLGITKEITLAKREVHKKIDDLRRQAELLFGCTVIPDKNQW